MWSVTVCMCSSFLPSLHWDVQVQYWTNQHLAQSAPSSCLFLSQDRCLRHVFQVLKSMVLFQSLLWGWVTLLLSETEQPGKPGYPSCLSDQEAPAWEIQKGGWKNSFQLEARAENGCHCNDVLIIIIITCQYLKFDSRFHFALKNTALVVL